MPRKEFVQELCSAVHDRDHTAFLSTLASKAELALYQRIYEGPGFKEYLQRSLSTAGQQGALLRFQLRSGTSMLRQHDSRFRDQPSHDTEDRICPACGEPDSVESVHHALLHCPAYEHHRAALRTKVARLPAAQASPRVLSDNNNNNLSCGNPQPEAIGHTRTCLQPESGGRHYAHSAASSTGEMTHS